MLPAQRAGEGIMAKGYWIARITVNKPEDYPKYVEAAKPAFEKYGAKFLARGGRHESVEGDARARNVIIEFESFDQALACYNSPEYKIAIGIRQGIADGDIVIVEGVS
jgi:uncharacterized protein (DUF1330 family)